jgi:KUP system potassium uptake protein
VLIVLFSIQRFGTGKVSVVFGPVIAVWLLFNTGVGIYNLTLHGWGTWQVGRG